MLAVKRGVLIVLAVIVLLVGSLWLAQRRLIYFPSGAAVPPAAEAIPGARDVVLETPDGLRLGAWLVPAVRSDTGMAVLVANGNAGNRASRALLGRALAKHGLTVLLFDYRGYGRNPGSPTEKGLAKDVRAARQYLIDKAGFPPDRLIYYGESLGAAVVTELAAEHPPAGLLLRSPFVDLASVGELHYPLLPVRRLLKDRYPLAEQLAKVKVPVTIVYGTGDSIVPAKQSRAVADAVPGPVRVVAVDGADHNDRGLLDGDALVAAVVELADDVR